MIMLEVDGRNTRERDAGARLGREGEKMGHKRPQGPLRVSNRTSPSGGDLSSVAIEYSLACASETFV